MPIFNTYSKRKKGMPDVFDFDTISDKLKNQVIYIWNEFFKQRYFDSEKEKTIWKYIDDTIRKEEGKKILYPEGERLLGGTNPYYQVKMYFDNLKETDKILDVIEIIFLCIHSCKEKKSEKGENSYYKIFYLDYSSDKAIEDLNYRFRENGVGYEFTNGKIIRVDNQLLHKEIMQPTLSLLYQAEFKNANDEFLEAHRYYKCGDNKGCLSECLKSFESTMKIICQKNVWDYTQQDTAKKLINILLQNNFFPSYQESALNAIQQFLESSIPTIRNKNSAHGQGEIKIDIPNILASYMLYITGATIKLIIETQIEKEKK